MISRNTVSRALAVMLVCTAPVLAGGFHLITGNPEANAEARALKAVLTVKAVGCGQPESAKVTATAIRVVNGRRESIPLKVTQLSEKGMFAITRQWGEDGNWVIQLVAREGGRATTTLVSAGPQGLDRMHPKYLPGEPADSDVTALLMAKR